MENREFAASRSKKFTEGSFPDSRDIMVEETWNIRRKRNRIGKSPDEYNRHCSLNEVFRICFVESKNYVVVWDFQHMSM